MSSQLLLIESFYGGSHKQLIDLLERELEHCTKVTLPAKKWHWRARTSALYFAQIIPEDHHFRVLFCSSVLNLAELVALRPDLSKLKKVLYFHENQLEYPVRKQQDRDFQYGYNQILSCLAADDVIFNSQYNMESFLGNINSHLKLIPDHRPKGIPEKIRPKCKVVYFPLNFDVILSPTLDVRKRTIEFENEIRSKKTALSETESSDQSDERNTLDCDQNSRNADEICTIIGKIAENDSSVYQSLGSEFEDIQSPQPNIETEIESGADVVSVLGSDSKLGDRGKAADERKDDPLHIVWPHRWEHDKDPDTFFSVMFKLHDEGYAFRLSVLGETYTDVPEIFEQASAKLKSHVAQWGFIPSKQQYYQTLHEADIVVSTAKHEFFGVAMIEAAYLGCFPLCPNRLVYPEIFPEDCLYNTENQLYKRLREFCKSPHHLRKKQPLTTLNLERFSWANLKARYKEALSCQVPPTAET